MERLAVAKVRREFSETVNRVAHEGRRVILLRNGKDVAALVPIRDLEALEDRDRGGAGKRSAREAAAKAQGLFRRLAPGRDLAAELIRERREEARREAGK